MIFSSSIFRTASMVLGSSAAFRAKAMDAGSLLKRNLPARNSGNHTLERSLMVCHRAKSRNRSIGLCRAKHAAWAASTLGNWAKSRTASSRTRGWSSWTRRFPRAVHCPICDASSESNWLVLTHRIWLAIWWVYAARSRPSVDSKRDFWSVGSKLPKPSRTHESSSCSRPRAGSLATFWTYVSKLALAGPELRICWRRDWPAKRRTKSASSARRSRFLSTLSLAVMG